MSTPEQPQVIPSNIDRDRADRVVESWLRRYSTGVAPMSTAADELTNRIAVAIAEGRHDELTADVPEGTELDVAVAEHIAQDRQALIERLVTRMGDEVEVATLTGQDGRPVRFARFDSIIAMLRALAVRAGTGAPL